MKKKYTNTLVLATVKLISIAATLLMVLIILKEASIDNILQEQYTASSPIGFIFLGSLLTLSLYHILLFILRKEHIPSLYLGLFAFAAATWLIIAGPMHITLLPALLSGNTMTRLFPLLTGIVLLLFTLYTYALSTESFSKKGITAIIRVFLLYAIFVILIPSHILVVTWPVLFIFAILLCLYLLFTSLLAVSMKMNGAVISLLSIFFFSTAVLHHLMCKYIWFVHDRFLQYGVLTYFFIQSLLLILKNEKEHARANINTIEIQLQNDALKGKIKELSYAHHTALAKDRLIYEGISKLSLERKNLEKQMHEVKNMSVRDGLTSLYNHKYIHERLGNEIERAGIHKSKLSIVMLDIDHFKNINDTYGHQMGDEILSSIADILKKTSRETDIIGRYGGEEFLILFPDAPLQNAHAVAERIRKTIEGARWSAPGIKLTISGGIVEWTGEDAANLISKADSLLFQSKNTGRNKISIST